jgi:hypothetical protein
VAVVILAWLKQVPAYLIVLSAIAVIALGLLGVNQFALFRERHRRGFSKLTDKEKEPAIREWIDIPGFTIKRSDVEDGTEAFFFYTIVDSGGRLIHIRRSKRDPDCIGMWADIPIPAESKEMHVKLTQYELKKLAGALTLEMLRLGCGYELSNFSKKGFLFRIYNIIPIDDFLTATVFKSEGAQLSRAYTLVIGIIGLTLQGLGVDVPMHPKATSQS